jgi:hypothetical protein
MKAVRLLSAAMLAVLTVGGLAGGVQVARAAEMTTAQVVAAADYQASAEERSERVNARLAHRLHEQRLMLDILANRLSLAREEAAFVQGRIDQENARGQDTTAVQAALDTFKAQVEVAQGHWNNAQGILAAAAGFDAAGNVVDAAQARTTLQQAGDAMRECGNVLRNASYDFRLAARDYLRNRLAP